MKYLIFIFASMISCVFGQETTFQEKVYPLLKDSRNYCMIFDDFNFHPTYVYERKEKRSHTITTLVSFNPDKKGSVAWSHFVTFSLSTDKDNKISISSLEFQSCNPKSQPCFQPKEVVSIDINKNMVIHKIKYPKALSDKELLKLLKK